MLVVLPYSRMRALSRSPIRVDTLPLMEATKTFEELGASFLLCGYGDKANGFFIVISLINM